MSTCITQCALMPTKRSWALTHKVGSSDAGSYTNDRCKVISHRSVDATTNSHHLPASRSEHWQWNNDRNQSIKDQGRCYRNTVLSDFLFIWLQEISSSVWRSARSYCTEANASYYCSARFIDIYIYYIIIGLYLWFGFDCTDVNNIICCSLNSYLRQSPSVQYITSIPNKTMSQSL